MKSFKNVFLAFGIVFTFLFPAMVMAAGKPGANVTLQNINVRNRPSFNGTRIDHILKNNTVTVKKVVGNWCQIEFKTYKNAFVGCGLLKPLEQKPVALVTPKIPYFDLGNIDEKFNLRDANIDYSNIKIAKNKDGNWTLGSANAPVKLEEFVDYECPYCDHYLTTAPKLLKNYIATGKVYYVFYNYPLGYHEKAMDAAEAALCAGDQNKYWPYHDLLLKNMDIWSGEPEYKSIFYALAGNKGKLGLDFEKFYTCMESNKFLSQIKKDIKKGQDYRVNSVSAYFVNGKLLDTTYETMYQDLQKAIDAKLKK